LSAEAPAKEEDRIPASARGYGQERHDDYVEGGIKVAGLDIRFPSTPSSKD
jgi:hypothetical protein